MGCDIHTTIEVNSDGVWKAADSVAFDNSRNYELFGFLANVRNVSRIPNPWPQRGWPSDISEAAKKSLEYWKDMAWGLHWISIQELKAFDYEQTFENRRTVKTEGNYTNCAALADPGKGKIETFRECLGEWFFEELDEISKLGSDVRILMFFED